MSTPEPPGRETGPPPPPRPPPLPPTRGGHEDADRDERIGAGRALGMAWRALRQLRAIYVVDAVFLGLALLVALSSDSVEAQVVCGVLLAGAVAGSVFVVRHPVPFSVGLALLHTPPAAFAVVLGVYDLLGFLVIGLSVLLWLSVRMAFNAQKLMRAHPDVWSARALRGETAPRSRKAAAWRDQARTSRRRTLVRVLLFVVLPIALIVAAIVLFGGCGGRSSYSAAPASPPTEPLLPTVPRRP